MLAIRAVQRAGTHCCLALSACAFLPGCGDSSLVSVSGTVRVNGQPAGPGSLMFEPANPITSTERAAIAHFGADGKYELMSAGRRLGTRPGEYKVTIHNRAEGAAFGDEDAPAVVNPKIPKKYEHAGISGLTATVKAGEDNAIDFDLQP